MACRAGNRSRSFEQLDIIFGHAVQAAADAQLPQLREYVEGYDAGATVIFIVRESSSQSVWAHSGNSQRRYRRGGFALLMRRCASAVARGGCRQ